MGAYIMLAVLVTVCLFVRSVEVLDMSNATVSQLIKSAGYPVEKYRVVTSDKYILQVHRIPAGRRVARKSGATPKGKKAVLLVHGLMGSSSDFLIMGPNKSLAYILADAGYDVWLGSLRGTLNTGHVYRDRTDPKFWDYSFHEHGTYDLPAIIDNVLNITNLPRLILVGYSMGGTSSFVMFSEKPEYNDKIIAFVGLAPAVYLANHKAIVKYYVEDLKITKIMQYQATYISSIWRQLISWIASNFCYVKSPQENLCFRISARLMGEDQEQTVMEIMALLISRLQPASWKQFEHYGKVSLTDVFTSWEDGLDGAIRPYNLSNVRVPVTLIYGLNDQLVEKSQIQRLAKELDANGVLEEIRPSCAWHKFNHVDFVTAKDLGEMVNKPLVGIINKLFNKYD
ncbi:unnamed protein product, partial [Leptidea sinapis]